MSLKSFTSEELVEELERRGHFDKDHVVDLADGFGIAHPVRCRPDLMGCVLHDWLTAIPAMPRRSGRWRVIGRDTHPSEWEWEKED